MSSPRRSFALALALFLSAVSAAPSAAEFGGEAGLHFHVGVPQGELADELDDDAYGIGAQAFFAPGNGVLALGVDVSFMNYGQETRSEPFSSTIPDVTVDVETSNNVAQGFLVLRLQTPDAPLRIYGDALVGMNYLFTETTIRDEDGFEDVASSTNQDDVAFAWGFGGGVKIPVWRSDPGTSAVQSVMIDAGVRYIRGGEAEYLEEGSIRREDGRVAFDTTESRTDLLRVHVGVAVGF